MKSIGYIRRATFGERSSFESFEEATEWLSKRLAGQGQHKEGFSQLHGFIHFFVCNSYFPYM
jgi:hypothetical protein